MQPGLCRTRSENPKTGFLMTRLSYFQETARNHFWEAGILMQSYMLEIVQWPLLNNTCPVYIPERGRDGLMVNTSDSGSISRGFEPHSGHRVVPLSKTCLPPPPQVLVIPGKRWLRPNMPEKLFTGTLSIKPNQNIPENGSEVTKCIDAFVE